MLEFGMFKYKSTHNHTVVGIDPANDGAMVMIKGEEVPVVVLWKKKTRQKNKKRFTIFEVQMSRSDTNVVQKLECKTSAHVGAFISKIPEMTKLSGIAVEDVYLARNVKTTVTLARFAGSVSAPLVVQCGLEPYYVKPTEWRKVVLGMKAKTKREKAKHDSLRYIPMLLPSLVHHLNLLGEYDHITDATGIALWLAKGRKY